MSGNPERPKRPYRTNMSRAELRARAQIAAQSRWARTPPAARAAATTAARDAAALRNWYLVADELGVTNPAEREILAKNARDAAMARARFARARKAREAAAGDAPDDAAGGAA